MIRSKNSQLTLFLDHVYFPLGTPLHHVFCCFPISSSSSSEGSHIFCYSPCCLRDFRWSNLTAQGFFAVSVWWLSAQILHYFFPLSNITSSLPFKSAKSCPLCPLCCCRTKGCRTSHSLSLNTQYEVFSSPSSEINPIPSCYHFTILNKAKYPLSVQTMKSFIPVFIFLP